MAYTLWAQDIFSKGELSPYMYARCTVNEYNNGLKTAQNVLTYPTGAAGKRFGTLYESTLNFTNPLGLYFQTFQYLNECVYQLVFYNKNIDIYLEGIFVANVTTTLNDYQVYNANTTVLNAAFRMTGVGFAPYDLTRSANGGLTITGYTASTLVMSAAAFTPGIPLPFQITGGVIPTSDPQIISGVTYFLNPVSATAVKVYTSAYNAKFDIEPFTFSDAGTVAILTIFNTWSFALVTFKNVPVYDFNGITTSYDALTFTPSATTGTATVTVSGAGYAPLIVPSAGSSQYIGGSFSGAGGTSRITAVASATSFTISVENPFDSINPISGTLVFLAQPAWSDAKGWPQVCSSYQNRALFANTPSLPNGFWASVVNDYADFGDLTTDDDDAISWYPTSNNMNFIRFIVPYRSITVHTNTGIYSSPLSDIAAITPNNFTLQLQDSTPADVLQPQAIDNQVLVLSGNDAHQMLWDGINNAYTSDVVSVINEQTIRNPVDEAAFADLHRAGSRFVLIVNEIGTLAVFQTLLSQNVSGFTPQIMEQSNGTAKFLQTATSADGRAWFVVEREIAEAASPIAITAYTPYVAGPPIVLSTLTATASNFSTTIPTAITFTTTGALPASSPQITTTNYFWAMGVTADTFNVYTSQADALAGLDSINFTSAGTSSYVVPWLLTPVFTLEELTKETFLDCAIYYTGSPTDTISTGILFNSQDVAMVGDGYGFTSPGENNVGNQIVFNAHGSTVNVSKAYIGFPIHTIMEPMPLNISSGPSAKESVLTKPLNIRFVRFMFNNTIGGTINGVPIALSQFDQVPIGEPPVPQMGIFEMSIFNAWDDFNNPMFTIEHSDPFDIQLLGVFYSVETS